MEVLKRDGTLRAEAANILDAMERLNQAATAKQIADVYQKQHGSSIGKGYLDAVLADAKEKGLVFKNLGETYELTAKGRAYLKSYRSANAFGMELKPKTEENCFESKAAKTPENKNQTASVSRAEVRLAQKNNTEKASKREKAGAGQQNLEGGKMVKKSAGSNAGNVKKEKVVVGTTKRATEDDVSCPFCQLYYPFGTIKCPKCGATIGSADQTRKAPPNKTVEVQKEAPVAGYSYQPSSSGGASDVSWGSVLVGILGAISAMGGSSILSWTLDSVGTGSGDVMNAVSSLSGSSSEFIGIFVAEGPVGTTVGFGSTGCSALSALSAVSSDAGNDGEIPIWEDSLGGWHIGDNVPYSVVEKRAETVYNVLHGQKSDAMRQPIIVAKTREQTEAVNRIFRTQRGDAVEEKLDLWISLLEKDEYVS